MNDPFEDPIVEEVRRVREELAARFNYDLDAIFRDIKEKEKEEERKGRKFVSFAPRRTEPTKGAVPATSAETVSEAMRAKER